MAITTHQGVCHKNLIRRIEVHRGIIFSKSGYCGYRCLVDSWKSFYVMDLNLDPDETHVKKSSFHVSEFAYGTSPAR